MEEVIPTYTGSTEGYRSLVDRLQPTLSKISYKIDALPSRVKRWAGIALLVGTGAALILPYGCGRSAYQRPEHVPTPPVATEPEKVGKDASGIDDIVNKPVIGIAGEGKIEYFPDPIGCGKHYFDFGCEDEMGMGRYTVPVTVGDKVIIFKRIDKTKELEQLKRNIENGDVVQLTPFKSLHGLWWYDGIEVVEKKR